jgi:mannose/fructose/N-acetylgalactosamine-specific phosphotransferase system component IIB
MPIVLTRIDDRLLHGQVSLGWGPATCPHVVVVADDRAAADPWEREVYEASGPEDAEVRVLDVATAAAAFPTWCTGSDRVFVIVRESRSIVRLIDAGCEVGEVVNVGGLHEGASRTERGFGYFLSPSEIDDIRELEARGVRCEFRALPADPPRSLADVLNGGAVS